jgi:hypothetical protein
MYKMQTSALNSNFYPGAVDWDLKSKFLVRSIENSLSTVCKCGSERKMKGIVVLKISVLTINRDRSNIALFCKCIRNRETPFRTSR